MLFIPAIVAVPLLRLVSLTSPLEIVLTAFSIYLVVDVGLVVVFTSLSIRELSDRKPSSAGCRSVSVTVAIAAHNEEERIVDCLRAVLGQTRRAEQVIIIDDGSTDRTRGLIDSEIGLATDARQKLANGATVYESKSHPGIILIDHPRAGKAKALNTALEMAQKDVFVSVDGDTIIHPCALERLIGAFDANAELVAAGGMVTPANGLKAELMRHSTRRLPEGLCARLQSIEYALAFFNRFAWARLNSLVSVSGCFAAFRTDALRECGGYDAASMADDYEIVYRLHRNELEKGGNYRIVAIPDALAYTVVPSNTLGIYHQRRRWAHGFMETLLKYRHMVGRYRYRGMGILLLPLKFIIAAQTCWGVLLLPVTIIYLMLHAYTLPNTLAAGLLGLRVIVNFFGIWVQLGLSRRYMFPYFKGFDLIKLAILGPAYICLQQALIVAVAAGILRAMKVLPNKVTDSYSSEIVRNQTIARQKAYDAG